MSSDSSSEEDLPLSALATKSKTPSSASSTKSRTSSRNSSRRASVTTKSYEEESEAEFDEDFEEQTTPKPKPVKKRKTADTSTTKKKADTKKKKPAAKKKESSKSSTNSKNSSAIVSASSELYAKSEKGKLISEFLCRWWYAMSWPDVENSPIPVPPNCDAMDGFPGVFVVTSGEDVGSIIDKRDKDTCPCFNNMVKKSSKELKDLLLKAIEEQRRILIEKEGTGTQTEKDLKALEKWTRKVSATKADKEAKTVLKAARIKLD